ncbi:MAG: S16 family serine protease [Candidatus Woesearchaeota archaeon]
MVSSDYFKSNYGEFALRSMKIFTVLMIAIIVFIAPVKAVSISDMFTTGTPLSETKEIKLLAVQESPSGLNGSIADLNLEVRQGNDRVFLDTFPLSQIDTQISTRSAKEIACKYMQGDCSLYDFIYTIRSNSAIIGGPSAGAALAVITIATLNDFSIRDDVAITGTINSGGIIGPVSGVKYKIDAAAKAGLSSVIVPAGSMVNDAEQSVNYSPEEYGELLGIDVIEVSDLDDALYHSTGERVAERDQDIEIPDMYSDTMSAVAKDLCDRNDDLSSQLDEISVVSGVPEEYSDIFDDLGDVALSERERADSAMKDESFYAAASHCYGSNINYENMRLLLLNEDGGRLVSSVQDLAQEIQDFEDNIDSLDFSTLTDFEVYMIMKERIDDAKTFVENARDSLAAEDLPSTYRHLAQAHERLYTSKIWENFLGMGGKRFEIDDEMLEMSCMQKLSEAKERLQYIQMISPMQNFSEIQGDIEAAHENQKKGELALCISRASRAKSSANVFMNLVSVREDDLERMVKSKVSAARNVIISEQEKGKFPIMGYSYYEYADSLKDTDIQSAMIYAEYALELSWLDIYFDEQSSPEFDISINLSYLLLILISFFLGALFVQSMKPRQRGRLGSRQLRRRLKRISGR